MKKAFTIFITIILGLVVVSQPALAGGDKQQGDVGTGDVNQNGEIPFGDNDLTPPGPNY